MIKWILENTALFVMVVCGLALWVSLVVEYMKDYLPQFDPKTIVLAVSFVGTCVIYFCGSAYLGLAILWWECVPILLGCVFVAYISQNGYDKLVKRYKDLVGEEDDPIEDDSIEDEYEIYYQDEEDE